EAQTLQTIEPFRPAAKMLDRRIANELQPHRIELVQHRHAALRIPPLIRNRAEALDLIGIDRRALPLSSTRHSPSLQCAGCSLETPSVCIAAFLRLRAGRAKRREL